MSKETKLNGSSVIFKEIVRLLGGTSAVSKLIGVSRQLVNNWVARGKVPLSRVGEVASILGVSAWGLNYIELANLVGEKKLSWKETVESYDFPTDVKQALLKVAPTPRAELKKCKTSSK